MAFSETNMPCTFYIAAMGSACTDTREMLLELCVTELEDVALNTHSMHLAPQPVVQESSHPYTDDATLSGHVKIPGKTQSV
jgi:E3 ubiquitin-protein ligase HERC2